MDKKQSLKLINEAYCKIKYVLKSVHHGNYHRDYYALNLKEESEHRRFCPDGVTCGLTRVEAVKLFYVKEIVEALFKPPFVPTLKDYLSVRQSIFFAHSLALNYRDKLIKVLQGVDYESILKIDYAELMK